MSDDARVAALFARYLRVLGVPARSPSLAALAELTSAHLTCVPFENVSKLLYRDDPAMRLPPLERWLDGVEHHHFGGTCYANNSHLCALLAHLGYDARLFGADMSAPNVHAATVVRLEGREFLVDVGYGAPFHAPMALDLPHELTIALGANRYVLHPRDAEGRSRVEMLRGGVSRHGYVLHPPARHIDDFGDVIEASFRAAATFMNAVVIRRFRPNGLLALTNLELTDAEGERERRALAAPDVSALPEAIEARFRLPAALVRRAIAGLDAHADPWA